MKFFIKRRSGDYAEWYAGTVDRNAIWVTRKKDAGGFPTRERAEQRIEGLPADREYGVET